MMRLILAVSLRKSRSLPNVFIQGLLSLSPWARSLSDSASETSARKGIPRSAATVLARRKMASGISNVVFISHAPIFMGASQRGACFRMFQVLQPMQDFKANRFDFCVRHLHYAIDDIYVDYDI